MITSRHDKINRLFDNEMDLNEVTVFDELFSNHDSDVNRNGKKSKFRRCNLEKSDIKSLIRHAFISENEECIDNIFEDKCIYLNKKSERDNFENDAKYQKPLKLIEKIELDDDCKVFKLINSSTTK